MNRCKNIVIDLSESFILADHRALADTVIEVDSEDSLDSSLDIINTQSPNRNSSRKKKEDTNLPSQVPPKRLKKNKDKTSKNFGKCIICWDELLGTKPLVSTKCGHVYCLKCLEQSLQIEKRCPMCRCSLKGKLAYHPLYLNKQE